MGSGRTNTLPSAHFCKWESARGQRLAEPATALTWAEHRAHSSASPGLQSYLWAYWHVQIWCSLWGLAAAALVHPEAAGTSPAMTRTLPAFHPWSLGDSELSIIDPFLQLIPKIRTRMSFTRARSCLLLLPSVAGAAGSSQYFGLHGNSSSAVKHPGSGKNQIPELKY